MSQVTAPTRGVKSASRPAPRFTLVFNNGQFIIRDREDCLFVWVGREGNAARAHLAKLNAEAAKPRSEPCWHCNTPTPSDGKSDPHLCPACRDMARDSAVNEARSVIVALRDGAAPFSDLDDADRLKLLGELFSAVKRADGLHCDWETNISDAELIQVAASAADEISRRLGSVDPAPAERRRIEVEAQDDPHPDWNQFARSACGFHA